MFIQSLSEILAHEKGKREEYTLAVWFIFVCVYLNKDFRIKLLV